MANYSAVARNRLAHAGVNGAARLWSFFYQGDVGMMSNLLFAVLISAFFLTGVAAADWPQWRGPNRDGKAAGFTAPATWPKELTQKWKIKVGKGDSTPALVGDKLY